MISKETMAHPPELRLINQPRLIKINNTHYVLLENYTYTWGIDAKDIDDNDSAFSLETSITVKKGFRYDGASIPEFFWKFGLKPDGKHRAAALIHDFIYVHKGVLPLGSMTAKYLSTENQVQTGTFSRSDADRLFGKMMKESEVEPSKYRIMKFGVTYFGWIYWVDGRDLFKGALIKTISFLMLVTLLILLILFIFQN